MVDVTRVAGPAIQAPEDHRSVGAVEVMIFDLDFHAVIAGHIRPVKTVSGKRAVGQREEPVRMLDDPARIDAHVVGHHVTGQANTSGPGAVAQAGTSLLAAELLRDVVIVKGVSGRGSFRIAAHLLDALRSPASLPQSDQPQPIEAATGEQVQFFIRDLIQPVHWTLVRLGQLVQPHVDAFGHHDRARHPVLVRREAFVFVLRAAELRDCRNAGVAPGQSAAEVMNRRMKAHPDRHFLLFQDVERGEHSGDKIAHQVLPFFPNKSQLRFQRMRRGQCRSA